MPIYAYKCSSCGHVEDVLQKLSAAPLTDCPACGKGTFSKQVTAPQFQLKGSGWYVTDFKGGNSAPKADKSAGEAKPDVAESKPAEKTSAASGAAPGASTSPPAAASPPPPPAAKTSGE